MTDPKSQAQPIRVMAVMVVYQRAPDDTAPWQMLREMLNQTGVLELKHCLIHDNSPQRDRQADPFMPNGFELRLCPENVGTSGAYTQAIKVAKANNCEWLLLLDQDTILPSDYLQRASDALLGADILVPRVWHLKELISPCVITKMGNVRPTLDPRSHQKVTAISSGVLVSVAAIESSTPFPNDLWLDYVDHWMFHFFSKNGFRVARIDADLVHDLSLKNPSTLSNDRLKSILHAENTFTRQLEIGARLALPLRQCMRGLRFLINGQYNHAFTTFKHCIARR